MTESHYFNWGGIAALLLAVLFPIYWFNALLLGFSESALWADFNKLDAWDALFVAIGALEIAVYLILRQFLRHHINSGLLSALLWILIGLVLLFHATVLVDLVLAVGLFESAAEPIVHVATVGGLVIHYLIGIAWLIFAIALLTQFTSLTNFLKVFSIGMLIAAVFQLTLVLGVINVALIPALMLLLAVQFLRGEPTVEVV